MHRTTCLLLMSLAFLHAEVRTMTMREAVNLALKQNPDLVIARYDQAKAQYAVNIARDPFTPKVYGGSGAAYTSGYPASINGQPPSIFQAQTQLSIYNRPQSYRVAQAKENARGAEIELGRQQDDIAYRAASLWLDAQQAAQSLNVARRQIDSLEKVNETVQSRVTEGRALPIDGKRSALDLARAGQRVEALTADMENAETALAVVLGYGAEDRVRTTLEERLAAEMPTSEESSIEAAIGNSKDIRLLQSRIQAKGLELQEYKSSRYPVIDLVAQYNLLARYNFQDFFAQQFQRHNGQLGVSITLPLLVGSAPRGYMGQAQSDLAKLHSQVGHTRNQITMNTRKSFLEVRRAESARTVARLDLDVAREQVSVVLAQQEEGRVSVKDVEQARILETDKWIAFYEADHNVERVKLNLLRQTGTLAAQLR